MIPCRTEKVDFSKKRTIKIRITKKNNSTGRVTRKNRKRTRINRKKILYFVWSPPWHLYILLLANLLAFYLTFYLAFYLAYLLAFYLAYLLAFYLAYLLAFYLAYLLDRGPFCDSTRGGTLMYITPSVHFQLCERTPHSCSGVNLSYIYIYILLF